jgi:hypothetical protein
MQDAKPLRIDDGELFPVRTNRYIVGMRLRKGQDNGVLSEGGQIGRPVWNAVNA